MRTLIMALIILVGTASVGMAADEAQTQAQAQGSGQIIAALQGGASSSDAATTPNKEEYTSESINGEVSAVGKRFISIVAERDYDTGAETEVMIPVTEKTVFNHVKGLSNIKKGDLVSIEYQKPVAVSKGMAHADAINFIQAGSSQN